jgi:NTP pyrophosphatase (non-canonical NTP hydrolase)
MENMEKIVNDTIRKLILESEWGRQVKNEELKDYLIDEVNEFIESLKEENDEHMIEEAADVFMMLMYLVIKNRYQYSGNSITDVLIGINQKLRTRYSTFFDGVTDGSEEENWKKTKYIEKEIIPYLFCTNESCNKFCKKNVGQLKIENEMVLCSICGEKYKINENNLLLSRNSNRRKVMTDLEINFKDYLEDRRIVADEYFASHLDTYLQVMRYITIFPLGHKAFQNYFGEIFDIDSCVIDDFLILPLKNYLSYKLNEKAGKFNLRLSINDMLIRWVNFDYLRLKKMFCRTEENDKRILLNCLRNIIASIEVILKEELTDFYSNEVVCSSNRKDGRLVINYLLPRRFNEKEVVIKLGVEGTERLTDIMGMMYNLIIKLGIQYKRSVILKVYPRDEKFEIDNLYELVLDLFPMILDVQKEEWSGLENEST